jgi:hypothetical protein
MITDVDPNTCDPVTLQHSSKTIGWLYFSCLYWYYL